MLENIINIDKQVLKKLEGMIMNLHIEDVRRSLDQYTTLNLEVKKTEPFNDKKNQFILTTKTEESIEESIECTAPL